MAQNDGKVPAKNFVLYSLTGLSNWLGERRPRVDEEIHSEFGEN
jgi:hypothetical protein